MQPKRAKRTVANVTFLSAITWLAAGCVSTTKPPQTVVTVIAPTPEIVASAEPEEPVTPPAIRGDIARGLGSPDSPKRIRGYFVNTACIGAFEKAKERPKDGSLDGAHAAIEDSTIAGLRRLRKWVDGSSRPAGTRLFYSRLFAPDTGKDSGWAASCVDESAAITQRDLQAMPSRPGTIAVGFTQQAQRRLKSLPANRAVVFVLDEHAVFAEMRGEDFKRFKGPISLTFASRS